MGLFGSKKTSKHGGGDGRGNPAPPRRVHAPPMCGCGKGKPVGHNGPCKIPTGTFRNGQKTPAPRNRKPSTSDRYIKPMGRGV